MHFWVCEDQKAGEGQGEQTPLLLNRPELQTQTEPTRELLGGQVMAVGTIWQTLLIIVNP